MKKELEGITDIAEYNLKPFYIRFAANANRILVDYKKFREHLLRELKMFSKKNQRDESNGQGKNKRSLSKGSSELSVIIEKAFSAQDNEELEP